MHLMGFTVLVHITDEKEDEVTKEMQYTVKIYYKPGFKRFQLPHMEDFEDLLWDILEMQDLVEARPEDGKEHETS